MREYMWGLYSLLRDYRKIFLRDHFPHISQSLEGIHFRANACRACIHTRANTRKYSWRIISCIGFVPGGIYVLPLSMEHCVLHFLNRESVAYDAPESITSFKVDSGVYYAKKHEIMSKIIVDYTASYNTRTPHQQ